MLKWLNEGNRKIILEVYNSLWRERRFPVIWKRKSGTKAQHGFRPRIRTVHKGTGGAGVLYGSELWANISASGAREDIRETYSCQSSWPIGGEEPYDEFPARLQADKKIGHSNGTAPR